MNSLKINVFESLIGLSKLSTTFNILKNSSLCINLQLIKAIRSLVRKLRKIVQSLVFCFLHQLSILLYHTLRKNSSK